MKKKSSETLFGPKRLQILQILLLFGVLIASVLTDPLPLRNPFFVTLFDPEERRFGIGGNETVGIAFGYHGYPDVE